MSQNAQVYEHIKKHGSISQAEAMQAYGIYRLAARIYDLTMQGIEIYSVMVDGTSRYGKPTRYARYYMPEAR